MPFFVETKANLYVHVLKKVPRLLVDTCDAHRNSLLRLLIYTDDENIGKTLQIEKGVLKD